MDNGYNSTVGNPELFLFRYRSSRRYKKNALSDWTRKRPRYSHPATVDASIKWAGWKFFAGNQSLRDNTLINSRVTEWALPALTPYERFELTGFNKYMFWQEISITTNSVINYDTNIFLAGNQYKLSTNQNQLDPNLYITLSGNKQTLVRGGTQGYPKAVKYAFAVGIDNPNATKTNGLCPKIFGPMSEPVHAVWATNNNPDPYRSYVMLVNEGNSRLTRQVREGKF